MTDQVGIKSTKGTMRPDCNENVESQHRGRKHEWKSHDRFNEELPAAARKTQPVRYWEPNDDQDQCRQGRQLDGDPDRSPIHKSMRPLLLRLLLPAVSRQYKTIITHDLSSRWGTEEIKKRLRAFLVGGCLD